MEDSCPLCQGHAVGRIGANLYYCRDCFVEICRTRLGWKAYHIDEEGCRVPVTEMISETGRENRIRGDKCGKAGVL